MWDFVSLGESATRLGEALDPMAQILEVRLFDAQLNTSSMTAEKYARERIVPSGGAPGARKIRRAAAKTNGFSTAARGTLRCWSWAARKRSGWRMVPAVPGVWR